jgi:hypothetical protein
MGVLIILWLHARFKQAHLIGSRIDELDARLNRLGKLDLQGVLLLTKSATDLVPIFS